MVLLTEITKEKNRKKTKTETKDMSSDGSLSMLLKNQK